MKSRINRPGLAFLVVTLVAVGGFESHVEAGPSPDLINSALQSRLQASKVPKGETVAMVCAQCKTVLLSKAATKEGFLGWFQPKTRHECPGCGGAFSMKDVPAGQGGKLSASEYVHTCSKCGDDSAFCCVTQPGAGETEGMGKQETKK